MLGQFISELQGIWNWILTQLGWSGHLNWVHIVVLILALIGAMVVVRNLIGGHSVGGGGSTVVYPQSREQKGLPTSFYVGNKKLSDFSVKPEVYDFKVPSPTLNLSKLREPLNSNMELARKLLLPSGGESSDSLNSKSVGELSDTPLLEEGGEERRVAANSSGTSQPASPPPRKIIEGGSKWPKH